MPKSTSAWVITYGAEATQVVDARGASGPAGQVTAPTFESLTDTFVSVTAPLLVTVNEYRIVSPTSVTPLPFTSTGVPADFTRPMAAVVPVGVSVCAGGDTTGGPLGGVPVAVASLWTMPRSTSACVIT